MVVKQDFCCEELHNHISNNELEFGYNPKYREHAIFYRKSAGGGIQLISHCPWCGTKLPKRLRNEWFDSLEKEYNIHEPLDVDADKVPSEFKTDEWWKKRGL